MDPSLVHRVEYLCTEAVENRAETFFVADSMGSCSVGKAAETPTKSLNYHLGAMLGELVRSTNNHATKAQTE